MGEDKGKRQEREEKKRSQNVEGSTPLDCIFFSFSPTLFSFLHTLKSLKEKCQAFRIHTSKSHTAKFISLLPKLPFSCSRVACHLASNIPLFA